MPTAIKVFMSSKEVLRCTRQQQTAMRLKLVVGAECTRITAVEDQSRPCKSRIAHLRKALENTDLCYAES